MPLFVQEDNKGEAGKPWIGFAVRTVQGPRGEEGEVGLRTIRTDVLWGFVRPLLTMAQVGGDD